MALIRYFPIDPKLEFIRHRFWLIGIAVVLAVASLGLFTAKGLTLGIDFRGGIIMEVQTKGPAELDTLRSELNGLGIGEVALQAFGAPDVILLNIPRQDGEDSAQADAIVRVQQLLEPVALEYRRVESVGPKVGEELRLSGILATVLAMGGIALYIWFRFELSFGVAALIAILHDVLATVGFYVLTGYEFNLDSVAAVLTVAGYSINDKVVIFDRVREELRRYKKMPINDVLNKAINLTLSRTTLTSITTLLSLLGLYFFGGEAIEGFTAGIIFGIIVGTYSSWGLAVPLLSFVRLRPSGGDKDKAGDGIVDVSPTKA